MRKNTSEVIEAFKARRSLRKCEAIWTDGESIYSYQTCIATRADNGAIVVNLTKYSVTTTIHQNALYDLRSPRGEQTQVRDLSRGASPTELLLAAGIRKSA